MTPDALLELATQWIWTIVIIAIYVVWAVKWVWKIIKG